MERAVPGKSEYVPGSHSLGLFAQQAFDYGDEILRELPALSMPSLTDAKVMEDFFNRVRNLNDRDKRFLRLLMTKKRPSLALDLAAAFANTPATLDIELEKDICYIFIDSSYPFAAAARASTRHLFTKASFLNHSCVPNAYLHWNNDDPRPSDEIVLHAIRPIPAQAEITISYINAFQTPAQRERDLGFRCACPACQDGPEGKILTRRAEHLRTIDRFRDQFLRGKSEMQLADDELANLLATHTGLSVVYAAIQEFTHTIADVPDLALCCCPRVAEVFQLLYIIHAAFVQASATRMDIEPAAREINFRSALVSKLKEVELWVICLGVGDARTQIALKQLMDFVGGCGEAQQKVSEYVASMGYEVVWKVGGWEGLVRRKP